MRPTLEVVISSNRPIGTPVIPRAAQAMALAPFSGSTPACAARPLTAKFSSSRLGASITMPPTGPLPSSTTPQEPSRSDMSRHLTPTRPGSSCTVNMSSSALNCPPTSIRCSTDARIEAMPALQSAPRIVSLMLTKRSPRSKGMT